MREKMHINVLCKIENNVIQVLGRFKKNIFGFTKKNFQDVIKSPTDAESCLLCGQ